MDSITIRKLQKEDLSNGFLQTLDSLRITSNTDKKIIEKTFDKINSNQDQLTIVALLDGKVVGATTLLIETKFIHNGGKVGHIEDVVVNKEYQKKGIGEKMITYLLRYAKEQGCYKTILDCVDDVKPFYEKLGFKHNANALRFDHV
ncbi:MAG: GNAT family N-acetyltransferase [Nitrosarchaeum sp.]|jgi:glucosamine-phosphate N-acetyltransferase|uniref:GNAT family N-acetyltransferase n=1 Tax=Nitrosarchaeum sp. TaxID=2026886 RepID=UPI002DF6F213|nr:GNAT family N-acetyltransferase [Nitrosarchaeum sp.]MEC4848005.1 GNAT family N-acetyltransferase [Nitrosarchaeum sp.]